MVLVVPALNGKEISLETWTNNSHGRRWFECFSLAGTSSGPPVLLKQRLPKEREKLVAISRCFEFMNQEELIDDWPYWRFSTADLQKWFNHSRFNFPEEPTSGGFYQWNQCARNRRIFAAIAYAPSLSRTVIPLDLLFSHTTANQEFQFSLRRFRVSGVSSWSS